MWPRKYGQGPGQRHQRRAEAAQQRREARARVRGESREREELAEAITDFRRRYAEQQGGRS